jgi:hypothetical protein
LNRRLANVALIEPQLRIAGQDPQNYRRALAARRKEILDELRRVRDGRSSEELSLAVRIDERNIIDRILFAVGPWTQLSVHAMSEGINQQPVQSDTSGSIVTARLYNGGVGYGGAVKNDNPSPGDEQFWIHNENALSRCPRGQ